MCSVQKQFDLNVKNDHSVDNHGDQLIMTFSKLRKGVSMNIQDIDKKENKHGFENGREDPTQESIFIEPEIFLTIEV